MTTRSVPWCVVVMPCLNEQDNLLATCVSLGFGGSREPPLRCVLVLVDNGSTDATPNLCAMLQAQVGPAVVVVREPERGYVPARLRGNLTAKQVATAHGFPAEELVVVQADADTTYSPGYVDRVRSAILEDAAGAGHPIGQAVTQPAPDLASRYPTVLALVDLCDLGVRQRFGRVQPDALVDDKATAYLMADYDRWGGHRREYLADGSEVLAETTRLAIAGLAHGANRIEIADAHVVQSPRRLLADATQHLASAGYPYSGRRVIPGHPAVPLESLERSAANGNRDLLDEVLAVRAAHLVALTVLLPAHLARTIGTEEPADPAVSAVLRDLPARTAQEAATTPGRLLGDVLGLAASPGSLLGRLDICDRQE